MPIRPRDVGAKAEMNMTPMIDIVFQILIFFILVSDLQTKDFAQLALPMADQAKPDVDPPKGRMTINVKEDGQIILRSVNITLDALGKRLKAEAEVYRDRDKEKSDKPILIRADRDVEYSVVQDIMKTCVDSMVWKLSFAAAKPQGPDRDGE